MNLRIIVGIIMAMCACSRVASAQTDDWNGTGDWVHTPANWSTGVPGTSTDAVIQTGTVTVSTKGTAARPLNTENFSNVDITGLLTSPNFQNEAGATVTLAASGTLTVTGTFTQYGGATMVLGNAIDFTPGSFVLSGATTSAAILPVNGSDTGTLGTVISQTNGEADELLKNGTGKLVLNKADTYSGGTEISAGTIEAENNSALGSGAVTVDSGASLQIGGKYTLGNAITISGTGAGGAGAIFSTVTAPDQILNGKITLAGNASVNNTETMYALLFNGPVALGTYELTLGVGDIQLAGQITGTGGLTVNQKGVVLVTGTTANTYTGLTTVSAGTVLDMIKTAGLTSMAGDLDIGGTVEDYNTGQLTSTAVVTLSGNGLFNFRNQGTTETIGGLEGTSGTLITPYLNGGGNTLSIGGSDAYVFAGQINDKVPAGAGSSSVALKMIGSGSQELDGASNYSGGTTVTNGTLIAGNSAAFGMGSMTVGGGTLELGNGNRVITIDTTYTQSAAGTLMLNVDNATADQVNAGGLGTLSGTLALNFTGVTPSGAAPGTMASTKTYTLLTSAGLDDTRFTTVTTTPLPASDTEMVTYTADDVLLNITTGGILFPGSGLDSNQQAVLGSINGGLASGNTSANFTAINAALAAAYAANPATFAADLIELSPEEFGRFTSETAFNNASFETEAMDNYLAGLRDQNGNFLAGNGGIDSSGLTINDPSYDPNLAMVHSRLMAWNAAPFSNGLLSDSPDAVLGGVDMKDSKNMKSVSSPAYTNPWNFFVRGNVILAQGFSQADVSHFDDNTESVVLGTDYRLTPNFLIGLSAGYGHTDVTLDDNGSSATVDSYSPGFYASYADKGWYADLTGDYVHNAYTQSRVVAFLGQTANGAPQGNEGVANLDGGYDFHRGALTFGPVAGVQYTHLTVDGYNETGSVADLTVNDQEDDSLRSRLGGRLSYALSCGGLTFRPHLDATWQHEFMDPSRGITSQFDGAGLGSFTVRTENPQRDFALADVGMDIDVNQTVTAFLDYTVQAGQDNYFGQSVQGGVKIGF